MPMYKIRNVESGLFSHGVINKWVYGGNIKISVKWSKTGKVWNTEKALKEHLLKYTKSGGKMAHWEIVEVIYAPTKPVDEWFDQKMLVALIKQ